MKMYSNRIRMSLLIVGAVLLGAWRMNTTLARQSAAPTAKALYQQALHEEEATGNLKVAIALYQQVLSAKPDRALTAQALLRMAECYQKLGDMEAQRIYARIVREFADQMQAVAEARRQLGGAASSSTGLTARQLNTVFDDITEDGRMTVQAESKTTGDLIVGDLLTGETHRLMVNPKTIEETDNFVENPIFSPDAREIAFAWFDGNTYQLRVVQNQTGAKVRVLENLPDVNYVAPIGWSRDRTSVFATMWKTDGTAQLSLVSLKDGSVRTLKSLEWRQPATRARLSPNDKYIVYSARERSDTADKRHIYILAADGSSESILVSGGTATQDPVWSPDGKYVLFISDRSGSLGLWAVAVLDGKAAGNPFLVKSDLGNADLVGVTRDGSYYYQIKRGGTDIFLADLSLDARKVSEVRSRLTEKFIGANYAPSWSPDGKLVAFKRGRPVGNDLVVKSLETGAEKTYTAPFKLRPLTRALWAPDGKSVVLDGQDNKGRDGYYRLDLNGGKFTEVVAPSPDLAQWANLSPDGRTLYVIKRSEKVRSIVAVDIATGHEDSLFNEDGAGVSNFALSPDGRTLALIKELQRGQRFEATLALINKDGTNYRELPTANMSPTGVRMLGWASNGKFVLYGSRDEKMQNRIFRSAIDGGKPEYTGLTVTGNSGFDVSPDGSRIAYSDGSSTTKEVWRLENVLPALARYSKTSK